MADPIRNCCGWFRRKVCLGEDGVIHSKFRAGVSERCAEEARRHLAHWPHAVESQRAGCGGPGVGADGFGTGLDSTRAGSPPPTAALVRRERTAALLSSAAAGALQRRFNWRAYAWSPSAGGTRARRWLVPAGWRMREGRHGWRSSLTSVQANRQHGLASDGEERRRVRLHAGMDCMLEWIERNSSTLSVRSTEKRTLLLGAPCMHVIKRLQCASNGPRRASPDFLRSHAHLNSPAQHFLSVCD